MANLPVLDPSAPPQPLPHSVQPGENIPTTDATKKAVEQWNRLVDIRPALADLMAVFDKHPELFLWIKEGDSGTMRVD